MKIFGITLSSIWCIFAFDEELGEIQNFIKEIVSNNKILLCDILRSLQIERPTLDDVGRDVYILHVHRKRLTNVNSVLQKVCA